MPNIATSQAQFDAAYKAAQPKPVQELMALPAGVDRTAQARTLAEDGYVIDNTIMVWDWDPWTTTQSRLAFGYSWVPSVLGPPIPSAPGVTYNGGIYDPSIVPTGAIVVTLDLDLLPQIFKPLAGTPASLPVTGTTEPVKPAAKEEA